jgi:DNA-binding beta-propeller fold protein YncE
MQGVVKTIKIGAYPRGITISNDSQYAFVAQMGGSVVHKISLVSFERELLSVGSNPRALVLSPDNAYLYATLNAAGRVIAYDLATNKVVESVKRCMKAVNCLVHYFPLLFRVTLME